MLGPAVLARIRAISAVKIFDQNARLQPSLFGRSRDLCAG